MANYRREMLLKMLRKIGPWVGARYLRNQGVPFFAAHCMILGCAPRFK